MKQFTAFIQKEFYHILRDKRTMLILLAMPIVMIIIFGFAISTEIRQINVAIVAPNNSESVRQITAKIDANEYFTVVGKLNSTKDIDREMRRDKIDIALIFGTHFEREPTIQFVLDATNPTASTAERFYLMAIIKDYFKTKLKGLTPPQAIGTNVHMLYNPQMKSSYNFVPGIMGLIFILICAMMTSVSIVREKEMGTMEVLLASPVKPLYIIWAKMIPYFIISCINLTTILLLAYFLLDIPMEGSLFLLCTISVVYIILSLSLGLLISTVVQSQVAAMFASLLGLMLPVLILSGMMFPIENMPLPLQGISNIIPARWYIAAVRKLMIEGLSFTYVAKELFILLGMTLFLTMVALKKFKTRL